MDHLDAKVNKVPEDQVGSQDYLVREDLLVLLAKVVLLARLVPEVNQDRLEAQVKMDGQVKGANLDQLVSGYA